MAGAIAFPVLTSFLPKLTPPFCTRQELPCLALRSLCLALMPTMGGGGAGMAGAIVFPVLTLREGKRECRCQPPSDVAQGIDVGSTAAWMAFYANWDGVRDSFMAVWRTVAGMLESKSLAHFDTGRDRLLGRFG